MQPTPRRVPQTPKPALRPLVLHFDINKTIVMSDSVTGTSADNMVNALLSEVCWGTWDATCARGTLEEKIQCAATWQLDSGPSVVGPRGASCSPFVRVGLSVVHVACGATLTCVCFCLHFTF